MAIPLGIIATLYQSEILAVTEGAVKLLKESSIKALPYNMPSKLVDQGHDKPIGAY